MPCENSIANANAKCGVDPSIRLITIIRVANAAATLIALSWSLAVA